MQSYDVVIIGGGMVGLSLAAALNNSAIKVAIIEGQLPDEHFSEIADNRVSALSAASERILSRLGTWPEIADHAAAYQSMEVWDQDSFGRITFAAEQLQQQHLGHIVENRRIQLALLAKVKQQTNVTLLMPHQVKQLAMGEGEAWLQLHNGQALTAKLVVGADGAQSWTRQQMAIPLVYRDYQHHAIVATVATTESHQGCARQAFTPQGPLAFLPLSQPHQCSIVWSVSPERASELMALTEQEFNKALTMAFDNQLGLCRVLSHRFKVPLAMRYARNFAQHRCALVGDAAHTIHPLAGQGVNLGLLDAASLAQEIIRHHASGLDIGQLSQLRQFERWRKAEAVDMILAMEALKQGFSGNHPLKKLIRDVGLTLVDKLTPLKQSFMVRAMGQAGELPDLAKP
nr:FAD-dependent monooxygenase [Motilimonas pumila]